MGYEEINNDKLQSALIKVETLQKEYEVTLRQYQEAGKNYINLLQNNSSNVNSNPCNSYTADSKGISQNCYDKIWKDQGCNTKPQDVNSPYPKALTMDGLAYDSFLWATMTDNTHRQGCYGTSTTFTKKTYPTYPKPTKYYIIGVGTDGNLYVKQSLSGGDNWRRVTTDDANGTLRSVCTGIDGHTLYCTNSNNQIYYKSSWDYRTWTLLNTGGGRFKSVAASPDGNLLGVGLDNTLYKIMSNGSFTSVKSSEQEIGVAVGLDGSVFVCNSVGDIYKKNSYQNLPSQGWQYQSGGCCVKAMTIAPDGTFICVGMNNTLYTKTSYTNLTTAWAGPYTSSCCVLSITTVPNPNYNKDRSSIFSSLKGRTWWGTGGDKEGAAITQEDCEDMCSSSVKCTGATFNPVKRYCWTRTGDGNISAGLGTDYALIPKQTEALIVMKNLNAKLLTINEHITNEIKNISPVVNKKSQKRDKKHQQLNDAYQRLLEQKIEMEARLQEHYSLEQENNNQTLYANQQSGSMRAWMLIACLVMLITIIKLFGSNNPSTSFMIWLLIIIVLIVLTFSLSSPSGFSMWLIVLMGIILMKGGYLYSP